MKTVLVMCWAMYTYSGLSNSRYATSTPNLFLCLVGMWVLGGKWEERELDDDYRDNIKCFHHEMLLLRSLNVTTHTNDSKGKR